jgi:hypothetical protein
MLAAAAGAAVGVATLRTGGPSRARPETWTQTYEPEVEDGPPAGAGAPASAFAAPGQPRHALPGEPTMQTRIAGVLGLVVVVFVAAGAIVGLLYAAYLAVRGMFGG